jgi:hypothetical protein
MEAKWSRWGLGAVVTVVVALLLGGVASASGSGYNLTFSQAARGTNANTDLVAVSSNDPGGPNITVQFTVAGTLVLNSDQYVYGVWFGGSGPGNSTAAVEFSNNSTAGFYDGYGANSAQYGYMPYTLSAGGATLTFSIAKTIVPPPSSFALNAYAATGSKGSYSYSWLGSSYSGGGSCTTTSCTTTTSSGSSGAFSSWWLVIIPVVVVVVIVIVVLVLLMRRKPAQPGMMPPPGQPSMAPPGQTGWGNPPPPTSPPGAMPPPPGTQ